MTDNPNRTELVTEKIAELEVWKLKIKNEAIELFNEDEKKMYPLDQLAMGAVKRTLVNARGFTKLIADMNLTSARALTRLQIDTAARMYSIFLVENAQDLAKQFLQGTHIRKIKDKSGKKMTDRYLIEQLANQYPWVTNVYENLCGIVHFSDQHFFSAVTKVENEIVTFELTEVERHFPEKSWVEIVECFNESLKILLSILHNMTNAKST